VEVVAGPADTVLEEAVEEGVVLIVDELEEVVLLIVDELEVLVVLPVLLARGVVE
jgi:hypothetical protein